ncbi:MAG TPA: hypothetical protein VHB25_18340, partial [Gemmatimonadaceae bacterium]|nr:hypothetical protein [Gemmatimonadaceae bacterium]
DLEYLSDPRPAVHELASLLVGDQPEAYTVKFASYFNTLANYSGSSFFDSAYGLTGCGVGANYGFGFNDALRPISWYLATPYFMSAVYGYSSCYTPYSRYIYGFPTVRIAQNPPIPVRPSNPTQPRAFNPNDRHTRPEPRKPGGRMPISTQPGTPGNDVGNGTHFSTEYRRRGLIAEDNPRTPSNRHRPEVGLQNAAGGAMPSPSRPTIQQMVERRATDRHEGWSGGNNGWTRAQNPGTGYDGTMRQAPATRPSNNPSAGNSRGYTSPFEHGTNAARYTPPRSSGAERPAPASHPAPVVSSPPPAAAAPSSPPPSSPPPSSSSSGRPGHPGH